jgi:hypothetical protein
LKLKTNLIHLKFTGKLRKTSKQPNERPTAAIIAKDIPKTERKYIFDKKHNVLKILARDDQKDEKHFYD